jgi:hypothetical protein
MVVCVNRPLGLFYRINTKDHWRPAVALKKTLTENTFLEHDSFLECGDPLDLDDYVIEEAIRKNGVVGRVSASVCNDVISALDKARDLLP